MDVQAEGKGRSQVHRASAEADAHPEFVQSKAIGLLTDSDAMYMYLHSSRDVAKTCHAGVFSCQL